MVEYKPGTTKTHAGQKIAEDCVFFAPPPKKIGRVKTAHTSLLKHSPLPLLPLCVSYPLCVFGLGLGISLLLCSVFDTEIAIDRWPLYGAAGLLSFLIWKLNGPLSQFYHDCTYVGDKGVARFLLTNQRKQIVTKKVLLFDEARYLYHKSTLQLVNHMYRKTVFSFTWTDQHKSVLLQIDGDHGNKSDNPEDLSHPYYFGQAAEVAWNDYLRPRVLNALKKNQVISFKAGDMTIDLSREELHFSEKSKRLELGLGEIHSITCGSGLIEMHHSKYMQSRLLPKLWSGKGFFRGRAIRLPYASLSNADLFLSAVKVLYADRVMKNSKDASISR